MHSTCHLQFFCYHNTDNQIWVELKTWGFLCYLANFLPAYIHKPISVNIKLFRLGWKVITEIFIKPNNLFNLKKFIVNLCIITKFFKIFHTEYFNHAMIKSNLFVRATKLKCRGDIHTVSFSKSSFVQVAIRANQPPSSILNGRFPRKYTKKSVLNIFKELKS